MRILCRGGHLAEISSYAVFRLEKSEKVALVSRIEALLEDVFSLGIGEVLGQLV